MIDLSIIIVTYNRKNPLIDTLDCLQIQENKNFDLVIVDASPKDKQLSSDDLSKYDFSLNYHTIEFLGNISKQRNIAIGLCKPSKYTLFLDDDVTFESNFIDEYYKLFTEYPDVDGFSGMVLLPHEKPTETPTFHKKPSLYNAGDYNYQACTQTVDTYVICTANFAIKTDVLKAHGFNESIKGTLDDLELGMRLKLSGKKVIHHSGPRLIHHKYQNSGSRSTNMDKSWAFTNLFYYQIKYRYTDNPKGILYASIWDFCRPSSHWFKYPLQVIRDYKAIIKSYKAATKLIANE